MPTPLQPPNHYDPRFMSELVSRLARIEQKLGEAPKDYIIGLPAAIAARGVSAPRLILIAPTSGRAYRVDVDDSGTLTTTLVTL